jgi:hypothetical protein
MLNWYLKLYHEVLTVSLSFVNRKLGICYRSLLALTENPEGQ